MPYLVSYAQRVRYPNGMHSGPFLASFSKAQMVRASEMILSGEWPDTPHDDHQIREFASGSSRLSCAWGSRYWTTAHRWGKWNGYIGPHTPLDRFPERPPHLYQRELVLLLSGNDEEGYHFLHALGIDDVNAYLARSVLLMAKSIEEATGWA